MNMLDYKMIQSHFSFNSLLIWTRVFVIVMSTVCRQKKRSVCVLFENFFERLTSGPSRKSKTH